MTTLTQVKNKLTVLKPMLQERYPLVSIAVFGSDARNEQTEQSDVELNGFMGLKFLDMADEIEVYLGIKTDVIKKE